MWSSLVVIERQKYNDINKRDAPHPGFGLMVGVFVPTIK